MMPNKALHRTAKSGAPIVALLFAAGELGRSSRFYRPIEYINRSKYKRFRR
jgi:hypothetical protein